MSLISTPVLLLLLLSNSLALRVGMFVVPVWIFTCFFDPFLSFCCTVLFIASPFFLYLDRVQSTIAVLLLIAGTVIIGWFCGTIKSRPFVWTPISRAALLFAGYMTLNCVCAILRGNKPIDALNELVPVLEMYVCFWLALRMNFSHKTIRTVLSITLVVVGLRAAWQLLLFLTGHASSITPPVYFSSEQAEFVTDVGLRIVRLLDPMCSLNVATAFAILFSSERGEKRCLEITVLALTGAVLILSLERAEWLATIVCALLALYLCSKNWKKLFFRLGSAAAVFCIAFFGLSLVFQKLSLNLEDVFLGRMIGYTQEQLFDPQNSLQALRLLEYGTVANAFIASPLFGHGLGANLGTAVSNGTSEQFVQIHNYFLNLLASAGIIGVGLFLYLAVTVAKCLVRFYRSAETSLNRKLLVYTIVGCLWYAIFVSFHPVYSAYHIPAVLGFYVGVAVSLTGSARNSGQQAISPEIL